MPCFNGQQYTNEELAVLFRENPSLMENDLSTNIEGDYRISPNIPLSVQREFIENIAYQLVKNQDNTSTSNKESVRKLLTDRHSLFTERVSKLSDSSRSTQKFRNIISATDQLGLVLENFDVFVTRAQEFLDELSLQADENGFYDNLEQDSFDTTEVEDIPNSFDQDKQRTTNYKEFLPGMVKQLMYFIPEMRLLNPEVTNEKRKIDAGQKYTPVINGVGLEKFNDFNDTWTKILSILTDRYFESTPEGIEDLLKTLKSQDNPIVVQQFGNLLSNSPEQVKIAAFNKLTLQLQRNITNSTKLNNSGNTTRIFNSDSNSGYNIVYRELGNRFRNSLSSNITIDGIQYTEGIISKEGVRGLNTEYYSVNKPFATILRNKLTSILDNKSSYIQTGWKESTSDPLTDSAIKSIYQILNASGVHVSEQAVKDFIQIKSKADKKSQRNTVVTYIDGRILKPLSIDGSMDLFVKESNTLKELSRYEYRYFQDLQSGPYRIGDKSYYPFVKSNMLSDVANKLKQEVSNSAPTLINQLLGVTFSANSMWLQKALEDSRTGNTSNVFGFNYELGTSIVDSSRPVKLLKEMGLEEHLITKLNLFQNNGAKTAIMLSDTMSDKSTMPLIRYNKLPFSFTGSSENNTILLDDDIDGASGTLTTLLNYFFAEHGRILEVQKENKILPSNRRIKGYHHTGSNKGLGSRFVLYNFLNKEALIRNKKTDLYNRLYDTNGELIDIEDSTIPIIKSEINQHFADLAVNNINSWIKSGILNYTRDNNGAITGIIAPNLFNKQYLNKSLRTVDGGSVNTDITSLYRENPLLAKRAIDQISLDYVLNYSTKTFEMLMLTGDPAQAGKAANKDIRAIVRAQYGNDPIELEYQMMMADIQETSINLSKRNAGILASGERGKFNNPTYKVGFAKTINIDSPEINNYINLLGNKTSVEAITEAYQLGDKTDAQEVTTLEERLDVLLAFGKINRTEYSLALSTYGNENYVHSQDAVPDRIKLLVFQPDKPVQRSGMIDNALNINRQYYLKSSSYVLVPAFVKGTPLADLLVDMKRNNVGRVIFTSGVKQGDSGANNLFNEDNSYNTNFFGNETTDGTEGYNFRNKSNIHELNRSDFRIQLEVPYKDTKSEIVEGTQQSKIITVDIKDSDQFTLVDKGNVSGEFIKNEYVELHKNIYQYKLNELLKEIDASPDGDSYVVRNPKKLISLFQEELSGRDFDLNALMGLDLDFEGNIKIPLTFSPNATRFEPVLTALVGNRVAKSKLPGKSFIQGSSFVIHNGQALEVKRKGAIKSGTNLEEALKNITDQRDIIWTSPDYIGLNTLAYNDVTRGNTGKTKTAQVMISNYLVVNGKKIDLRERNEEGQYKYLVEAPNGSVYLNTDMVDESLLYMNGYRIPFQGHNSGNWFEIVGFLPSYMGDLILVPGEIAAQMGSDYDVDKLYAYMYNYYQSPNGKINKITNSTKLSDVNRQNKENYELVKTRFSESLLESSIDDEASQNNLLNSIFGSDYANLSTDANVLANERFLQVLDEEGLTVEDIKKLSEADLNFRKNQNSIIDIHQAIYTNRDKQADVLNPLSFDKIREAIESTNYITIDQTNFIGLHDPQYQTELYFSNKDGKIGTAVSAIANTFHSLAQSANLHIKGTGVLIRDRENNLYNSFNSSEYTNTTNTYSAGKYSWEITTEEGPVTIEHKESDGAARLDLVNTITKDSNGNRWNIAQLISEVLGVSVDNAKEQLLRLFGINEHNFNTVFTFLHSGFDLGTTRLFINQPILREFYKVLESMDNIYKEDFTPDKLNTGIRTLFEKYNGLAILERSDIAPTSLAILEDGARTNQVTEENSINQLEILKAFLYYGNISDNIRTLNSTLNVDAKGLPKNVYDTVKKQNTLNSINDIFPIGNTNNLKRNSIPGVVSGLVSVAVDLFTGDNKLFAYSSDAYNAIRETILSLSGKSAFFSGEDDIIHNNIKQFVYSGFTNSDLNTVKEDKLSLVNRLLYDTETNKSLLSRVNDMKVKYKRNKFLRSINEIPTNDESEPRLFFIGLSEESDFTQKVVESLEFFLESSDNEDRLFGEDIVKYAINFANIEFGSSNMMKFIPFRYLESIGFTDYLNQVHRNLNVNQDGVLTFDTDRFSIEFLQHNLRFNKSVQEKHFVKGKTTYLKDELDKDITIKNDSGLTQKYLVTSFTLPNPNIPGFEKLPASGLTTINDLGVRVYPKTLVYYNNQNLEKRIYLNDGNNTYNLIPNKGLVGKITEYSNGTDDEIGSIFPSNNFNVNIEDILETQSPIGQQIEIEMSQTISSGISTLPELLGSEGTPNQFVETIKELTSSILNSDETSVKSKQVAQYYNVVAEQLAKVNFDTITIKYTDDSTAPSAKTSGDGSTITLNPLKVYNGNNKSKLPKELNASRIILHELLHAVVFKTNKTNSDLSPIVEVWDEYRNTIWNSGTKAKLRGINLDLLEAELTKVLVDRYSKNKQQGNKDLDISSIEEFMSRIDNEGRFEKVATDLLKEIDASIKQLVAQGKVSEGNYDLYTSDSRRADAINFIREYSRNIGSNISKYYAYTNIHEFITEGLTNPVLISELEKIPSLWNRFKTEIVALINRIFGIDTEEANLFTNAVDVVFEYIDPTQGFLSSLEESIPRTGSQAPPFYIQDSRTEVLYYLGTEYRFDIQKDSIVGTFKQGLNGTWETLYNAEDMYTKIKNSIDSSNTKLNTPSIDDFEDIGISISTTPIVISEVYEETYVDLEGNPIEGELITYPSDAGNINYIRNSDGELVMVRLNTLSLQSGIDINSLENLPCF